MINRQHRFHGRGSLRFVYERGATVRGPFSALKYVQNSRRITYRAAVVVSRKVHKNAVVRNRIRRRIYSLLQAVEAQITAPYDLVFLIYSDKLATVDAELLQETVISQLQKAGVLPPDTVLTLANHAIVENKEN